MPIVDPLLDQAVDFVCLPDKADVEAHFSDYIYLFHTQTAKRLFDNFYFIVTARLRLQHDENALKMVSFLSVDQQLRDSSEGKIGLDHPECINRWQDMSFLAVTLILSAIADMSSQQIKQWYVADLLRLHHKYNEVFKK